MKARMDAYLREVDAQFPTPNPDYDPANPPSPREKKGGKGGKGGAKGKGR